MLISQSSTGWPLSSLHKIPQLFKILVDDILSLTGFFIFDSLTGAFSILLKVLYVYLVSIALMVVEHHRKDQIFPDFWPTTFYFPDFSKFSRLVATPHPQVRR